MPSKPSESTLLPVAALLVGAGFWGVLWFPLRVLDANGLSGPWSSAIIYGAATAVGLAGLIRRPPALHHPGSLLLLALASGWCNVAFIVAVIQGQVVRVLLLFYLSPLWTVLLGRFLLREPLSAREWLTIALAMAGALVMLWDPSIGLPWPRDATDALALSAGFAFALSNVMLRKLRSASVWFKAVLAWAGVAAVALAWIAFSGSALPRPDSGALAGALALGALGLSTVTLAVVYGVSHLPAHRASVILLFELVIGAASAQWLTDEAVRPNEWAGGALILLAGWFAARSQMSGR
jgi:drug/metabolite transporter (DMT)-like permease